MKNDTPETVDSEATKRGTAASEPVPMSEEHWKAFERSLPRNSRDDRRS